MFKRLKHIEAMLSELLEHERECLQIVKLRKLEIHAYETAPWKCKFTDCTVEPYHLHTLPATPAKTTGEP